MYPYKVVDKKTVEIKCVDCKETKTIEVGELGIQRLEEGNMLIRAALPTVPKELREMFLSGLCPDCYAKMLSFIKVLPGSSPTGLHQYYSHEN